MLKNCAKLLDNDQNVSYIGHSSFRFRFRFRFFKGQVMQLGTIVTAAALEKTFGPFYLCVLGDYLEQQPRQKHEHHKYKIIKELPDRSLFMAMLQSKSTITVAELIEKTYDRIHKLIDSGLLTIDCELLGNPLAGPPEGMPEICKKAKTTCLLILKSPYEDELNAEQQCRLAGEMLQMASDAVVEVFEKYNLDQCTHQDIAWFEMFIEVTEEEVNGLLNAA